MAERRKLTRITFGEIGDLVDPNTAIELETQWSCSTIQRKDKRQIEARLVKGMVVKLFDAGIDMDHATRRDFIGVVDKYLERENLYLVAADYVRNYTEVGGFPCPRIEGRLYKEKGKAVLT